MNIYLDESYNLQKPKGKMFISINGFAVLDTNRLRKRWKQIRKPYTKHKRRIHATDPYFEGLRTKSMSLLNYSGVTILSIFQLIQKLPHNCFDGYGLNFDNVYTQLLKVLLKTLALQQYRHVKIIIDSRKQRGGVHAAKRFQQDMGGFLKDEFPNIACVFLPTPSYLDILVELADFASNTIYRAYMQDENLTFDRLIQIKNPL